MLNPTGTPTNDTPPSGFLSASAAADTADAAPGDASSSDAEPATSPGETSDLDAGAVPEAFRAEDGTLAPDKAVAYHQAIEALAADRVEKFGQVPEGDYDLSGIQDSDGNAFEIDAENPFLKTVLPQMKAAGIGQKLATELLGAYAQSTAADVDKVVQQIQADQSQAIATEFQSLGAEGPARLNSMLATLSTAPEGGEALMSKDEANLLADQIRTKAGFELMERLVGKLNGAVEGRVPASGAGSDGKSRAERIFGRSGNK